MSLRLVLKNAAATATASGSRTFFTGPFCSVRTPDVTVSIHQFSPPSIRQFSPPTSARARSTPGNKVSEVPAADNWYRWKNEKNSWCLIADMPGLDKDNVKVRVEENVKLVISGEGDREADAKTYNKTFVLQPNVYELEGMKAEMKNGVLKVTVPRVQGEEKKVKNINVE